jgi:hypothetical protein
MNKKQVIRDLVPDALATDSVMVLMEQIWDRGKREGKAEYMQEKVILIKEFLSYLVMLKRGRQDLILKNIENVEELFLLKLSEIDATSV